MKRMVFGCLIVMLLFAKSVVGCSITFTPSGQEVVKESDLILHVVAVDYAKLPRYDPRKDNHFTTGPADSTVRFRVVEVVKGKYDAKEIVLTGFLGNSDDWNDSKTVPYNFVRPTGRHGSCFANTYKQDGNFLLMLKKTKTGEYTQFWYPLGPAEEQIRPQNDPWLQWVKNAVK
jgi:hypothetical protein